MATFSPLSHCRLDYRRADILSSMVVAALQNGDPSRRGRDYKGLRAGIPSIVIPFTADQPFWGRRVHAIGAGPRPIPVQKLSVEKLTQPILFINDNALRKRAQKMGQELRNESGVDVAINLIEKYANKFLRKDR